VGPSNTNLERTGNIGPRSHEMLKFEQISP
jgi:hypothetical protein